MAIYRLSASTQGGQMPTSLTLLGMTVEGDVRRGRVVSWLVGCDVHNFALCVIGKIGNIFDFISLQ